MLKLIAIAILSFASLAQAADSVPLPTGSVVVQQASNKFTEGKEYKLLPPTAAQGPTAHALLDTHKGKVEVIDFFNYGCPVCNRMEPALEKWADSKKSTQMVVIVDVPVDWNHPGWENLARAFYVAESLGVLDKMHPAMFNAIHVQNKNFKNQADMQDYFQTQGGVIRGKFDETYDSFAVRRRMKQGQLLAQEYNVMAIPSFVINGKYYADVQTAGGIQQLLDVVDFLVNKESFNAGTQEIKFDDVAPQAAPGVQKEVPLAPSTLNQ